MKQYRKVIDDKIVVFDGIIVVGDRQIINPTKEQLLEDGWEEYETSSYSDEPSEEEVLEQIKKEKIEEIENYDQSDAVNSFTINGQTMWLDSQVRQQLRTSVLAYQSMNVENVTKWFDGIEYTFTVNQWLQMLNVLEVYAAEALNVTESHKAAVNALTTIQEIEEYDITADYPSKITF